jgi:peptide/nickel transport system permease protein
MTGYLVRRFGYVLVTFVLLSIVAWIVIQLPPGDYVSTYINALRASGDEIDFAEEAALRAYYGLDENMVLQYFKWFGRFIRGDLGRSFGSYREQDRPVLSILSDVVPWTVMLSLISLSVVYLIAIPAGIWAATHQYKLSDYVISITGFIGLATPNFMLALLMMYMLFRYFDVSAGGLFSPEYSLAPWSLPKVWDLLQHLWVPVVVTATAGTASTIRTMRAVMLDELGKQYVITARAKGVGETRLLIKYPVRLALNPIVSTMGYLLPFLMSGSIIVSVVLSLPTEGPLLLRSLLAEDLFTSATILFVLGSLTVIGTLLSDIALGLLDPRIRYVQ